jgi:Ethylbenzene dehydrogenase
MSEQNNSRLIVLFVGSLFVVAMTMIVVIFVATRRPVVVVIPGGADAASAAAPASVSPLGKAAGTPSATPIAPPTISLVKLESAPAIDNPLDPAWEGIAKFKIPVEMQKTAEPMLDSQTVKEVELQAVHDAKRFVWRLSWEQAVPSYKSNVSEFSDAIAIQFPLKDGAPYTMGGPDMPVAMMYWKALWQKDIDEGFQDVTQVYPNSWYDLYWFAKGTGPQPVATAFEDPASRQFMSGMAAGNTMSNPHRAQPVQELHAEGFGSSTPMPKSPVSARGVWKAGRWHVVFERPNDTVDPLIKRFFENPEQQMLALAVWDGLAQNRGGKKHITNWLPMKVEK